MPVATNLVTARTIAPEAARPLSELAYDQLVAHCLEDELDCTTNFVGYPDLQLAFAKEAADKLWAPRQDDGVQAAAQRIARLINPAHTPLEYSEHFSERMGCNIYFKREDLSVVGAFKVRGAANKLLQMSAVALEHGVVASSAGNHAAGVAWVASQLGTEATLFMPTSTPDIKVQRSQDRGAKTVLVDGNLRAAMAACEAYCQQHPEVTYVHPYDDVDIISGQATIGLEISRMLARQQQRPDYIATGVGGGGLLAGLAQANDELHIYATLIGAEPAHSAAMGAAVKNGRPVTVERQTTVAEGADVEQVGTTPYELIHRSPSQVIMQTVSESEIRRATVELSEAFDRRIEPTAALGWAALQQYQFDPEDNVVAIITGGNIDESKYRSLLA